MQHSGMPAKPPREGCVAGPAGKAPRRTFQITTFRTELKNHVMVMDFVKSNWFPSQRQAQVCVVHMCPGLKTVEQPARRDKIHSRLFSSPKDDSAWESNKNLSNTGLLDNHYSTNDQIALKNLQSDVTERKLHVTKETLASPDTSMISSLVISQLMDEKKSKGYGAMLPPPQAIPQPQLCSMKPASANHSGVSIRRSFASPQDRLGILSPDESGMGPEPPATEDSLGRGPRNGFASITITARRVGPPASALMWGTVGDPLCLKCRTNGTMLQAPPALAGGAHRNGSMVRLKVPQSHTRLCAGHEYWVTHVDHKDDSFSPDTPSPRKSPLVFSSCVHLRVSRQCPSAIYYLDKSLSVPLEQPQVASPKVHRSVLSLNLRCSSHRLTADGVDSIANREPISRALKQELQETEQLQGPLGSPSLQESPALGKVYLEPGTCPWIGCPPLENMESADVGSNQVMLRKEKEDHVTHASSHANQLSIHIPGWSYRAVETKVFSGSSKEQQGEAHLRPLASPLEQTPIIHSPPSGDSSPSNDCQSRNPSEPSERRHPSLLRPRVTLPGFLCPLRDSGTSPQEDSAVKIERQFPEGDYTCCDLVVKLKECKKSEDPNMPDPSPEPPSPAPPEGTRTPDLLEDGSEPQHLLKSSMTLKEALEVRKPQFISRSRERLKKLEHMVQQRKAQHTDNLGQKQSLLPVRANRKQFTVPHPLSDNLFKPKERCISEKEMHMRSRRIYNNLPEVKKKKEEQKKRVILQSNRLRAEVFKKQLLDQLLHRNAV